MMKQKIFCIGLNKTGTSSLHHAFLALGYKSVHCIDDKGENIKYKIKDNYDQGRNILHGLAQYDVYLDWDLDDSSHIIFKAFDRDYPGSKYILNTRDLNGWLRSREKHYMRKRERITNDPNYNQPWPEIDKVKWADHFKRHHKAVFEYFEDRPNDLLIFDIGKGDGYNEICKFLGIPKTRKLFPLINSGSSLKKKLKSKAINFVNKFL